jgi:hypothetical protein
VLILDLPEVLSAESLQAAFHAAGFASVDSWVASKEVDGRVLHVDLSRLEFAEFSAVARVLLIAEAAARHGMSVRVDLPSPATGGHPTDAAPRLPSESDFVPTAAVTAARRARCLRFLRAVGFTSAIRLRHLPEADVVVRGREQHEASIALPTEVGGPIRAKRQVLPFRWLRPTTGESLFRSEGLVAIIRGLLEMGLPQRDAQLLGNAVLFELIENVAVHARDEGLDPRSYALVGALAMDVGLHPGPDEVRHELREFNNWTRSNRSSVVQIVVGDSGPGLINRLSPQVQVDGLDTEAGDAAQRWSTAEQIALGSLDRWSISPTEQREPERGTRGLWRTQRAVRSYGGALLIHTAQASAGRLFEGPGSGVIRTAPVTGVPGTLVEAIVLPAGVAVGSVVTPPPTTGAAAELHWLRLGISPDADVATFVEAENLVRAQRNLLLTVDGGPTHDVSHERLVAILVRAAGLATPAAVVVLVTGVDPETVDAGIDALHHPPPEAAAAASLGDPFLLIDSTGRPQWCAGSREVREQLERLTTEPISAVDPSLSPEVRAWLAGQPRIVRSVGDSIQLAVQPSDVNAQLDRLVSGTLKAAIDRGGRDVGVLRGRYRTPNLQLTDRWVNVSELLAGTVGGGVAAFLLAQDLATTLPQAINNETKVVQISPQVRNLSLLLAESVGLRHEVFQMADEFGSPEAEEPLPAGTPVLVCGDVLLTQNSAHRALKDLLSWDVVPLALVVPLDARGHDGPIEIDGLRIPVIALAEVSSGLIDPNDGPIEDIDPVFRVPVAESPLERQGHRWTEEEFLRMSADLPAAAGLGHVRRQPRRHFTVYFNAGSVVDPGSEIQEAIASETLATIGEWLGAKPAQAKDPPILICHVGSHSDYAGRLASLVAGRLTRHLSLPQPLAPFRVPRAVAGFRYAFPEALEPPGLPPGSDVILIDWGSFDSATILQLVRLAAEGGAGRILAVVLLSQLGDHEERSLTMVRSVSGAADGTTEVPTRIEFLTSLGVTPTPTGDCPLCRLATDIRTESRRSGMPREVVAHAEALAASLRPRTREEIVRRGSDAFGSPSTSEDALEYIRLRSDFLGALRSTARSARLVDRLTGLTETPEDPRAHAVIRLLAAERHWLGLPPGRLSQTIESVERLATSVALDQRLDDNLRLEALIVLATGKPEVLIEDLPYLWEAALGSDGLLLHLLYQVWVIVRRQSRQAIRSLSRLRESVARCRSVPAESYSSTEQAEEMTHLLTRLLHSMDRQIDQHGVLTPQDAWSRLREHYMHLLDRHPEAEDSAITLRVFMEELPREPTLDDAVWRTMVRTWDSIAAFLEDHVLAFTPMLADILNGPFAEEHLTYAGRLRLSRLASPDAVTDLVSLGWRLYGLGGGRPDAPAFVSAWQECAADLAQWYDSVLSTGGSELRRAELAVFLDGCPAPLVEVLEDSRRLAQRQPVQIELHVNGHEQVQVFCHRNLLRSVVRQIIDNTVKPSHRLPEYHDRDVSLGIEVTVDGDAVRVLFRNTGTAAAAPSRPGKGIAAMRRKLADFDAKLTPVPPSPGSTYEIELKLALWSAGGRGATA